jgi:hypothetical protein
VDSRCCRSVSKVSYPDNEVELANQTESYGDWKYEYSFDKKTSLGEKINFGFNDIRHIIKEDDFVILDRPSEVLVKFSTVEVEKFGMEIGESNFPIVARLGYY